ncbi:MAG: hypothetical protein APR54_01635 [Candidatus Cloacimonas sp. SDB]|nr:MAG: hypothetical protein APR54_01635 [Candidatus Cloacimonas sp. SDB]
MQEVEIGSKNYTDVAAFNDSTNLHPLDYIPDFNQDSTITINESFDFANDFDTWSCDTLKYYNNHYGYYNPHPGGSHDSREDVETPQLYPETHTLFSRFACLNGIAGSVSPSDSLTSFQGNCLIGGDLEIDGSLSFSFGANSRITLAGEGQIIVNENATLTLGNGTTIYGESTSNKIIVYGNIVIGDDVTFIDLSENEWGGLKIYSSNTLTIDDITFENCEFYADGGGSISLNNPTFTDASLTTESTTITIDGGSFENSMIDHDRLNLTLNNVSFTDTQVKAQMTALISQNEIVTIDSCDFDHGITQPAIYLNSFPNYEITNNTITSSARTCVYIYETGSGKKHKFEDNDVTGNNNGTAVYLYDSSIDILGCNEISYNEYAVFGSNNSNIYIIGDQSSPYQTIDNNDEGIKVYHSSFPTRISNTDFIDNNDYHIDCINHTTGVHDIEYNYWDPKNPATYLYPDSTDYDYIPIWEHRGIRNVDEAELLYETALDLIESDYLEGAQQNFFDIVEFYPETEYAKGSLKKLLHLEKLIDNDYSTLQDYYLNNTIIQTYPDLIILAEDLANFCNLYMFEFEDAIDFFEDIIEDPPAQIDSVFAVIDAGYTYLIMEELEYRSDFIGSIPSLKPDSWLDFEKKRDLLLGLTDDDIHGQDQDTPVIPIPVLKNNYPNPFNPETTIEFSIPEDKLIELSIYNLKGQKVKTLLSEVIESGSHSVIWDGKDQHNKPVSSGIYFYNLSTGSSNLTKKMILIK